MNLRQLQKELRPWTAVNFPDAPTWQPLLGLQEELGELSHAYLKRAQGIRKDEPHDAHIRDAVGDIVIYLADFCNREGIDLADIVSTTWDEVSQRDWNAHREAVV